MTTEIKTCKCGASFTVEAYETYGPDSLQNSLNRLRASIQSTCPACRQAEQEQRAQREKEQERQRRLSAWIYFAPSYFQNPEEHKDKCLGSYVEAVNAWEPDERGKGLFIMGTVGTGKTTAAWMAIKKAFFQGSSCKAIESSDFSQRIAALYSRDSAEAYDWIQELIHADFLLIDDLGKGKLTERVEEALFSVINGRMLRIAPTIITSNHDKNSFLKQWSDDRGAAILRRIKETSIVVI